MNITATLDGVGVTIVDVTTDGSNINITYRDASANLKVTRIHFDSKTSATTIATSATVVE